MALILASASPRRQELLRQIGLDFSVRAANISESMEGLGTPEEAVRKISERKARAISASPEDTVLAADTIVVVDNEILGKPKNTDDARRMLHLLSGRSHRVMTGFTVLHGEEQFSHTEITDLTFRPLGDAEIDAYIETGDPMDKAGAYGIQGLAALFVTGIRGDYFNVMGLPLCALAPVLRRFGIPVLGEKG